MKKKIHPNSLKNLIEYKKGKSGNPAGRKKGSQSFKTIIDNFMKRDTNEVNEETGEKLTYQETMVLEQMKKAMSGDINAFKELVDRSEGRAIQKTEIDQTTRFPDSIEIELVEPDKKKEDEE